VVFTKDDYACILQGEFKIGRKPSTNKRMRNTRRRKLTRAKCQKKLTEWRVGRKSCKKLNKQEIAELEITRCHHSL
jgi:hypothetical protein